MTEPLTRYTISTDMHAIYPDKSGEWIKADEVSARLAQNAETIQRLREIAKRLTSHYIGGSDRDFELARAITDLDKLLTAADVRSAPVCRLCHHVMDGQGDMCPIPACRCVCEALRLPADGHDTTEEPR